MCRLHDRSDAVVDVVVDEERPEERLLGFDVVGYRLPFGVERRRRSVCHPESPCGDPYSGSPCLRQRRSPVEKGDSGDGSRGLDRRAGGGIVAAKPFGGTPMDDQSGVLRGRSATALPWRRWARWRISTAARSISSTVWRTRLDQTTNWAVVTTGLAMSLTSAGPYASPLPLILVGLLVAVFLLLESRRYRYFNVWAGTMPADGDRHLRDDAARREGVRSTASGTRCSPPTTSGHPSTSAIRGRSAGGCGGTTSISSGFRPSPTTARSPSTRRRQRPWAPSSSAPRSAAARLDGGARRRRLSRIVGWCSRSSPCARSARAAWPAS